MSANFPSSLFADPVPAGALQHPNLRIQPVLCDAMEPTYRRGRDYVMVVPTEQYHYPTLYVLEMNGAAVVRRVEGRLDGRIHVMTDRKEYSDYFLTREEFETAVLGIVVADVVVRDENLIRKAVS
ncbi:S24 family peptidase [Marinicauda sp. Alg238-R41]|uniref:S24 family peptidase n=1 Tax=Marinicauda sp. Alg238-R41 TaxID=2993447 RepID=UPI0022E7F175|nr:S24 family peptidase [Marinicauda sp. Alg238-R41]